jgi:hypothetical protein
VKVGHRKGKGEVVFDALRSRREAAFARFLRAAAQRDERAMLACARRLAIAMIQEAEAFYLSLSSKLVH